MLFNAGDQLPAMLFVDVVGSELNVPPEQIAGTCVNVGVVNGFTKIVKDFSVLAPLVVTVQV